MSIDYFPAAPDSPQAGQQRHIISGLSSALPASATAGQLIYETDTGTVKYWSGTAWRYLNQTRGHFDRITVGSTAVAQTDGVVIGGSNSSLWITERDAANVWALYGSAAKFRINGSGTDMLTVNRSPISVNIEGGVLNLNQNDLRLHSAGNSDHKLAFRASAPGGSGDGPCLFGFTKGHLCTTSGGENWSLAWTNAGDVYSRRDVIAGSVVYGLALNTNELRSYNGTGSPAIRTRSGGNVWNADWSSGFQMWVDVTHVKTFVIDHPLYKTKHLIHGTLEGPEAGVYYRGQAQLEGGWVWVELPPYFEALCAEEGRSVQLTCIADDAQDEWCPVLHATYPKDGGFHVGLGSGMVIPDQRFWWEVKAVRKDVEPLAVEPLKKDVVVMGEGPYTYFRSKA